MAKGQEHGADAVVITAQGLHRDLQFPRADTPLALHNPPV